ncbi:uncharacterized protein TNCV_2431151 [Trichonephila clavipes]|nr:uncharacterized protein TNCV_2431151 [Trichonephila clavipes]
MDQIDAFPEHISTTVMPVTLPEKPDALEYDARQGHVRACIIYQEPNTKRLFVLFSKDNWYCQKIRHYLPFRNVRMKRANHQAKNDRPRGMLVQVHIGSHRYPPCQCCGE